MRKLLFILFCLYIPCAVLADNVIPDDAILLTEEDLAEPISDTKCATKAFADQLAATAHLVKESDSEAIIEAWIYNIFYNPPTLQKVLQCPEIKSIAPDDTIRFIPIEYVFPGGRKITINYETQPKIIQQRMSLANKRSLPHNPNPRIGAPDDKTLWTNTEPAWYAIMVVQSGSLNEFVGPDKNNTLSVKYINDNINKFYPNAFLNGGSCTSRSAIAGDRNAINRAVAITTGNKSNDYYVAGDIKLEWIGYVELALDVVLTVATWGGSVAASGAIKGIRAVKTMQQLKTSMKALRATKPVQSYIKYSNKVTKLTQQLKKIDKAKDAATYTKIESELNDAKKIADQMRKNNPDVKKYIEQADAFSDLQKYKKTLQGIKTLRNKQYGNMVARTVRTKRAIKIAKALHAARNGNNILKKGTKAARASKLSGRIKNWLYHTSMKSASTAARMVGSAAATYGAIKFLGEMWDFTETSTGDFTSDIEFKPLLLLSADDIPGQENVVNYGMWLMWAGDSTSAEDDDAAYLQAMDFAAKFHEDLLEVQGDSNWPCNVDIYVVKPVLRAPDTDNPEIYYLIMNDIPWTTNQ